MTEQPQFLSRRELREAERAGLIEQNELPFDGKPRVDSVEVPTHDTGSGLTRRQLRELEKTGGILAVHTSQIQLPTLPPEAAAPAAEVPAPASESVAQAAPLDAVAAEREEPATFANPVVAVPAQPAAPAQLAAPRVVQSPNQLDAQAVRAAAAYQASEFEALLTGAVQRGAVDLKRRRTRLLWIAILALALAGAGAYLVLTYGQGLIK